jgi:hypothetical protein
MTLEDPSTASDPVAKREYRMSPRKLLRTSCHCLAPAELLTDASTQIELMINRLDKLIGRLAGTPLHHEMREAGLRILYTLRSRGLELFHLVGWETTKNQGSKSRVEYSVVFAVPDQAEDAMHRAVAQMVVQVDSKGRFKGMIDTVSVRFEDDWDDWTMVQDVEYVQDGKAIPKRIDLDVAQGVKRVERRSTAERIWAALPQHWGEVIGYSRKIVVGRVEMTLEKLEMEGEVVNGLEVGEMFRKLGENKVEPAIAIRLYSCSNDLQPVTVGPAEGTDQVTNSDKKGTKEGGEVKVVSAKARTTAVVVLEMKGKGPSTKVKHVTAIHDEEGPIVHRYRDNSPLPTLDGLEDLVTG